MKLYKFLPLTSAVLVLLAGCASHTQVKVTQNGAGVAPVQKPVEMFDATEPPERPFRDIAHLSYDGVSGDYPEVLREFALKARELGADAIIMEEPVPYTGEPFQTPHMMFHARAIARSEENT